MLIQVELEDWPGRGAVIRGRTGDYERWSAERYQDQPARLTERQGVFYRNLIRLAEALQSRDIPVDFELPNGRNVWLDHGCIKIAEHAAFIEPLQNGPDGTVESIRLAWHVSRGDTTRRFGA